MLLLFLCVLLLYIYVSGDCVATQSPETYIIKVALPALCHVDFK